MANGIEYLVSLGLYECVGVLGFVAYLGAFGSVQFGVLDGNSASYSVLNVLAASFVAVSLVAEFNLASALIQASWIIIGLTGISLRIWKSRRQIHRFEIVTPDAEVS